MGTIIPLPLPKQDTPRDALIRYYEERGVPAEAVDHLLTWLWIEGFTVVPHKEINDGK